MNATHHRVQLVFAVALLTMLSSALALLVLPGSASAQTRVPPAPNRLAPLRATPVTPQMSCVHLTTDGVPGASFVGGAIKERCFAFPGDAGVAVSIVLKPAAAGAVPAMELHGPAGEVVARGKNGQINAQVLQATGPYALIVSGANLPKAIRVEASVLAQGGAARPTRPSPADSEVAVAQQALCSGVLKVGQTRTEMVPLPGADCRFTFTAQRGQAVSLWMESLSGGLRPEVVLLDPAGNVLDSGHAIDDKTRYASAMSLPVSGVYTVVAGSQGSQSAGAFKLSLNQGASAACGDALTLNVLTEVQLPGQGRSCELAIDASYSYSLRLDTMSLDNAPPPEWVVFGPQGDAVRSSEDVYPGWSTEQTGRYTVRLSPSGRQPQRVLVQVLPPSVRYIYMPTCGGNLAAGAAGASQAHNLTAAGGSCRFTFDGAAGDTIWLAVSAAASGAGFEPVVELMAPGFRPANPPEAIGDDSIFAGMPVIRDHELAQTGRYTVLVSDYGNDDTGSFHIRLWKW